MPAHCALRPGRCQLIAFSGLEGPSATSSCGPHGAPSLTAGALRPWQVINAGGVARMNRQLSVLQPVLAAAGAAGGQYRPEAVRAFERARTYYTLLTYSADSLVKVPPRNQTPLTSSGQHADIVLNTSGSHQRQLRSLFWAIGQPGPLPRRALKAAATRSFLHRLHTFHHRRGLKTC